MNSVGSVLFVFFSIVLIIIMIFVFLIYFLLDGYKFLLMFECIVLKWDKLYIIGFLKNLNIIIVWYISGVVIDVIIIGCLVFIGYSVIGLKYVLVFVIFLGLVNFIFYVGLSIGLILMIIVNVFIDFYRMLIVVVYMLII